VYSLPTKEIQEAAFQLNRRTEFAVIAKDYRPGLNAGISSPPIIQMVSDSSGSAIDFLYSTDGEITVTLHLNDYGTIGVIDPGISESIAGEGIVLDLLKKAAINRNDFIGDFEKIMVDGKIVSGSELIFKKVRFGEKVLEQVRIKVDDKIGKIILIGKDMMDKAGPFTVDEDKMQLIFK
jgi:hypothetical protein